MLADVLECLLCVLSSLKTLKINLLILKTILYKYVIPVLQRIKWRHRFHKHRAQITIDRDMQCIVVCYLLACILFYLVLRVDEVGASHHSL